jgi:hypothetical protein
MGIRRFRFLEMISQNECIWLALVGVIPLEGNDLTPNISGAYVRVACKLSSDNLESRLKEIFSHYHYSIFEIDDIKLAEALNHEDLSNEVTQQLLAEINSGAKFAWSTFHTWT